MTNFENYIKEYAYIADSDRTMFNQLFTGNTPIEKVSIDLYADSDECSLMLRTKVKKPTVTIDRGLVWFRDSDRYQTVVCDIPIDSITETIYKKYSDSLIEYLIELSGYHYKLLFNL